MSTEKTFIMDLAYEDFSSEANIQEAKMEPQNNSNMPFRKPIYNECS